MQHTASASPGRRPGLDILRLLAALLVFLQHSLSCSHLDQWIDIAGFRVGRIGTSLFFLLAGFLAASTRRPALVWFRDRVNALFPAFWLVTLAGFAIALISHTKTFDAWQVVCQLSGIGYFTHGERLVNVATWFMSPLLLLYLLVLVARLTSPRYVGLTILLTCGAAALLAGGHRTTVDCHAVTFFTAFLLALLTPAHQTGASLAAAALMGGLTILEPEFRYGTVSLLLLSLAFPRTQSLVIAEQFTGIAYEWFLVHGLCISVTAHLTQRWGIIVLCSGLLSLSSAILLQRTVRWLEACLPVTLIAANRRQKRRDVAECGAVPHVAGGP